MSFVLPRKESQIDPNELCELVSLVTGNAVGSWIFQDDNPAAPSELTKRYLMFAPTSIYLSTLYKTGWIIHEKLPSGMAGWWWSTVDDAENPQAAILGIKSFISSYWGLNVEPRFFATKNYEDEISGYRELQRKVFLTEVGPIVIHLRRLDEGRLNCWEMNTETGILYVTFLYQFGINPIQEVEAKFHEEPPEWVTSAFESGELNTLMDTLLARETQTPEASLDENIEAELNNLTLGTYAPESTLPQINMEYERTAHAFERYSYKDLNPDGSFRRWSVRPGVQASIEDLQPILTPEHERHHFQQLMTTPYGLYLWRLMTSLTSSLEYSLRVIREETEVAPDRLPFTTWYQESGTQLLPTGEVGGSRIAKLHRTMVEASAMSEFLLALMGRRKLTIGQFLELANTSQAEVCRAADLPMQAIWTTRLDPDTPYLPDGYFSTSEIIEAAARFKELGLIRGTAPDANQALEEAWRGQALHGIYRPAFEYLEKKLVHYIPCAFAIDLSMLGRLDPVTHTSAGEEILFEGTHPG